MLELHHLLISLQLDYSAKAFMMGSFQSSADERYFND